MNHHTTRKAVILSLLISTLVSCATRPRIGNYQKSTRYCTVLGKAFCDDAMLGKRIVVLPAEEPKNKLEYDRVVKYFKKSLAIRGYQVVGDNDEADIAVFFGYGSGEPKERTWVTSTPVYGVTGGGSTTINSVTALYGSRYNAIGTAYSTLTVYSPISVGVVGYDVRTHHSTSFIHYATLAALDMTTFDSNKKMVEKWNLKVVYAGDIADAYSAAPWLALASGRIAGKEVPKPEEIEMSSKDQDWLEMNGIRMIVINSDPRARGVFKRYTGFNLNKKGNETVESAIENALCVSGLEKSGKIVMNVDYTISGQNLYVELRDAVSNSVVGAATERDIKFVGTDWDETARYLMRAIAQQTMTDAE